MALYRAIEPSTAFDLNLLGIQSLPVHWISSFHSNLFSAVSKTKKLSKNARNKVVDLCKAIMGCKTMHKKVVEKVTSVCVITNWSWNITWLSCLESGAPSFSWDKNHDEKGEDWGYELTPPLWVDNWQCPQGLILSTSMFFGKFQPGL